MTSVVSRRHRKNKKRRNIKINTGLMNIKFNDDSCAPTTNKVCIRLR